MKKKTINKNEPIGKLSIVKDTLPSPQDLAKADQRVKITIELDEATVLFFKKEAQTHKTKYQRMMRDILNYYARKFAA
jgi:predicted DNA binding CopG/RHH family protein